MAFVCEICGGTSVIKSGDVFACEVCGAKYSVADVRKMMTGSASAPATPATPVKQVVDVKRLLKNGKDAIEREDWDSAERYYISVLEEESSNVEALFYSAYVNVRKSYIGLGAAYRVEALERMKRTVKKLFDDVRKSNAGEYGGFFREIAYVIHRMEYLKVPQLVTTVGSLSMSCSNEAQCLEMVREIAQKFVSELMDVAFRFEETAKEYREYLKIALICAKGEVRRAIQKRLLNEGASQTPSPVTVHTPAQKPAPGTLTPEESAENDGTTYTLTFEEESIIAGEASIAPRVFSCATQTVTISDSVLGAAQEGGETPDAPAQVEEEEAAKKKLQEDFVNQEENTELPQWLQKNFLTVFSLNSGGMMLFYVQDRDAFRGSSWQVVLGLSIAYGILTGLLIMAMFVFSIILGKQKDNTVLVKLSKIFAFVAAALTLVGGIVWHWLCLLSTLLLVVVIVIYFKLEKVRDWDAFMAKYKKEQSTSATPAPAPAPAASATDEPGELSLGE